MLRYSVDNVLDRTNLQFWLTPSTPRTAAQVEHTVQKAAEATGDRVSTKTSEDERRVRLYSEDKPDEMVLATARHDILDANTLNQAASATVSFFEQRPHIAHLKSNHPDTDPIRVSNGSTLSIRLKQQSDTIAGKVFAYELAHQLQLQDGTSKVAIEGLDGEGTVRGTQFHIDNKWQDHVRFRKADTDHETHLDANAKRMEQIIALHEKDLLAVAADVQKTSKKI